VRRSSSGTSLQTPVELAETFQLADDSKPAGLVEGNVGRFEWSRSGLLGRLEEGVEDESPDALALVFGMDEDAVPDNAGIATTGARLGRLASPSRRRVLCRFKHLRNPYDGAARAVW
jgi:hypothetical protein